MIKISDLRIGNLFFDDEGEISRLTAIDQSGDYLEETIIFDILGLNKEGEWSSGWSCDFNRISGMPLTEDSLSKLGLVEDWHILLNQEDTKLFAYKLSKHLFLKKNLIRDASGRWDGFSLNILCGVVFRTVFGVPKIQYVHQLQNIYHALTGEELNTKLSHHES